MSVFNLEPNEYVVSELQNFQDASSKTTKLCNILLTNKRIIVCKNGTFGKPKVILDKPISDIKIFEDTAQVKIYSVNGMQNKIDIYFSSGQISFVFLNAVYANVIQFANEINHIVTGSDFDIYSITENDTGVKGFMKSFLGMPTVEVKKSTQEKVAIKCPNCGASFYGKKSGMAKCPYCDSFFNT
ncbi:MAG: hypothetical protein K6F64_04005 [Clostridia bacterium]|nr:hypothetical protein [Clostridia bacterium]